MLCTGRDDRVAHEYILDIRPKEATGISEMDIAKRLIDYYSHAPTLSFPVPGTLILDPTESESHLKLDRFIDVMLAIRAEIQQVADGGWPEVKRLDDVYGDRNLFCSCVPLSDYQ